MTQFLMELKNKRLKKEEKMMKTPADDGYYVDWDVVKGELKAKTHPFYKEIIKLHKMASDEGFNVELTNLYDGWQVSFYKDLDGKKILAGDFIEHFGSYGKEKDLVEGMGFGHDTVQGYLTAEQAMEIVRNYLF